MMGSQSAPGTRVTVTKSLTPNRLATPGTPSTSRSNGVVASSSGDRLIMPGSRTSSVNLRASGFGVWAGVAVAMTAPYPRPASAGRSEHRVVQVVAVAGHDDVMPVRRHAHEADRCVLHREPQAALDAEGVSEVGVDDTAVGHDGDGLAEVGEGNGLDGGRHPGA